MTNLEGRNYLLSIFRRLTIGLTLRQNMDITLDRFLVKVIDMIQYQISVVEEVTKYRSSSVEYLS